MGWGVCVWGGGGGVQGVCSNRWGFYKNVHSHCGAFDNFSGVQAFDSLETGSKIQHGCLCPGCT